MMAFLQPVKPTLEILNDNPLSKNTNDVKNLNEYCCRNENSYNKGQYHVSFHNAGRVLIFAFLCAQVMHIKPAFRN